MLKENTYLHPEFNHQFEMDYTIKHEIICGLDCVVVYPKDGHDSTFIYCHGGAGNC